MKFLPFLILALCLSLASFAQPGQEAFGKISKSDLEAKKCASDPQAEAEVLFDVAEIEVLLYAGELEIYIKKHERIKIYNEKGLEVANIKIGYIARHGSEIISKLEGATYNLDAAGNMETVKLDKQSIFNKKKDNQITNLTFTMPAAKVGSVIEYKYVMKRRLLYFDDWVFQRSIPVRFSHCTVDYPEEFIINPLFKTVQEYTYNKKKSGTRIAQSAMMVNIRALREEPYMTSVGDYLQKVDFRISGYFSPTTRINFDFSWAKMIRELMEDDDFGLQLKKNIPRTSDLDAAIKSLSTQESKMAEVHHYVRKNMTWDGTHSIWAMDGVKQAWEKKKGNSGEINLILVNLLKDAGLNANPILLSTRENGRINTLAPGYWQFNTVMAYVRLGNDTYILDATDPHTPVHLIPRSVLYTEGLVISKIDLDKPLTDQDWGWATLWDPNHKYTHRVNISGTLGTDGQITGESLVMESDYARASSIRDYRKGTEQYVEDHFAKSVQGMQLNGFKAENVDSDSLPLQQTFKFSLPSGGSGNYNYFSTNMFSGFSKNPFISEARNADVFFGVNQVYSINGVFAIPEGYAFEELPQNTRMITPDTSIVFSRMMQVTNNRLQFRINLEVNRPVFPVDEYPDFQAFYKKLYMMLNEQIVVKKIQP